MKYKIIEEKKEEGKEVEIGNNIVYLCHLCKTVWGEGEIVRKKGMNVYCPNCPKTVMSWMSLDELG